MRAAVPTEERDSGDRLRTGMADHLVADKYQLIRLLGEGAAGAVCEAENVLVGRRVAIKLLHPELTADEALRARFLAEARASARIAHPNVVDVFDVGRDGERPFIVMELFLGETLESVIGTRGALGVAYGCELMLQVLAGLDAAHRLGIVHRDLKPANIMVVHPRPDSPVIKVLDFGIAKGVLADDATPDETGLLFGTAEYISPEAVRGGAVDARSDLYAAGCILHELLAGRPPFVGDCAAVLEDVVATPPRPLGELVPGIPRSLENIVLATLSKDPSERPPSARDLMALLAPFTETGRLPSVLPPATHEEPLLLTKREPVALAPKPKPKLVLVREPSIPPPPIPPTSTTPKRR